MSFTSMSRIPNGRGSNRGIGDTRAQRISLNGRTTGRVVSDAKFDHEGCWSGTAIVKDDVLYLFYASLYGEDKKQTISIAYSEDGIHFEKYAGNPGH